jgi:hypothetical protein
MYTLKDLMPPEMFSSEKTLRSQDVEALTQEELRALMQDNSEPNVFFASGQPTPAPFDRRELQALMRDNSEPGVMFASGQPMPPVQQVARRPEPQNYIQRTGGPKISLDHATMANMAGHQVFRDGPQLLAQEQLPNGNTREYRKVGYITPDGQQATAVVQRESVPDYLDPNKLRELDYRTKQAQLQKTLRPEQEKGGGTGTWKELEAGGKRYRMNTKTGELVPMVIDGEHLDDRQFDKRQKAMAAATAAQTYANDNASALERTLADILGTTPEELPGILGGQDTAAAQRQVAPAVGVVDSRIPTIRQSTKNIDSAIANLQSKAQMYGLTNLRQSGVAPGSITEKEWPKFGAMLANVDPALGEAAFVKQLQDIYQQIQRGRRAGQLDMQAATPTTAPNVVPQVSGAANQARLMQEAQAAIARGAPREAVMARLQQQLQGR